MNSMRIVSQRVIYAVAAVMMALAVALPAIVSAAQVSERSVALSNASAAADNVAYTINFTPVTAGAGAFVVDFCSNSPLVGEACTAPTGFASDTVSTATAGFTIDSATANRVVVAGTLTAATPVSVEITGITNPSAAGTMYARIVTFDTAVNAAASTPESMTGDIDNGGAAISITPTIGVSGVVLETLTFCVSGAVITESCGATTSPVLELGETFGDVTALQADTLSTGSIYTQISTNAVSGAVIHLKSSATNCGGLLLAGDTTSCHIAPALDGDISTTPTAALFGVKTAAATATNGVVNATGTLQPVPGSFYAAVPAEFAMNYVDGNTAGVTSTFGDPFLNTADAPVNNMNMQLTFGASATNNTPAGTYSADLSMIAVGKF